MKDWYPMSDQQPYRVYYYTDEDGWIVGEVPELPGCMSQGRTLDELLENIRDAIAGCVAVRRELGMPERVPFQDVTVSVAA
jgi:predicted RNase H-like HicB family nuclease